MILWLKIKIILYYVLILFSGYNGDYTIYINLNIEYFMCNFYTSYYT